MANIRLSDSSVNSMDMQNKQKVLEYLKKEKLKKHNLPKHIGEEDFSTILDAMSKDLVEKTSRNESLELFSDYIFTIAIQNVEEMIPKKEVENLAKEINNDNWYLYFGELLSEKKYLIAFLAGLIFGYTKLSYRLQVEPSSQFTSIVNVLPII